MKCDRELGFVTVVFCTAFLMTGVCFGSAPFLLILLQERQYEEVCHDKLIPCPEQLTHLGLVNSAMVSTGALSSFAVAMVLDQIRARLTILIGVLFHVIAFIGFALSSSVGFDVWLPCALLEGLAGTTVMLGLLTTSLHVPRLQNVLLSGVNLMYDASAVIFMGFYQLYQRGFSRSTLFLSYAGLIVLCAALLILLWPPQTTTIQQNIINNDDNNHQLPPPPPVKKEEVKLRNILLSPAFFLLLIFALVNVTRSNIYIGSTRDMLGYLGDMDHDFLVTTIFSYTLAIGVIPLTWFIPKILGYPTITLLRVVNVLMLIVNGFTLIPYLFLQIPGFLLFAGTRALIYCVIARAAADLGQQAAMGRVLGCTYTLCGITSYSLYVVVYVAQHWMGGSYVVSNAAAVIVNVLLAVVLEYHSRSSRVVRSLPEPVEDTEQLIDFPLQEAGVVEERAVTSDTS